MGYVEVPRATEVVLGTGAADGRELVVAVHVELDLALTPPTGTVDAPRQVGADVVPWALDTVQQRVHGLGRQRVAPPPLRVQVRRLLGYGAQPVVDLEVDDDLLVVKVLQGQLGPLAERHLPAAVEVAVRGPRHR